MPRPLFSLFSILFVIFIIALTNFSPSHFLMGWDNLMPEFNIWPSIKRSIFSVWQESHGLGVLVGNAYAADLPHQIIVLLLSFLVPLNIVRWIYTFGMLCTGAVGSYFLMRKLLGEGKSSIPALLGGLFYLLNLATIQNFFIPFEPFITFFGFLPLLILTGINFIGGPNRKSFFIFLITNLLGLPLAQVPTIFIVYIFTQFFVLAGFYVQNRNRTTLRNSLKLFLFTALINSFWLLPFIYFLTTSSNVAYEAKINQMSTPVVLQQNKEFGNLEDVMLLKGFWFNNVDLSQVGFERMFDPWQDHLNNPLIILTGYTFFIIILIGVLFAIKSKDRSLWGFVFLFISGITLLTLSTPPFSFINAMLREIPLFNQVFRSPFTKFSTVLSLTYAIFFAIGLKNLMHFVAKWVLENSSRGVLGAVFLILLLIYAFPIFQGQLFYSRVKTLPPKEYFDLFNFFQNQDKSARIANFPQYTFWGWSFYDWPARQGSLPQASAGGGYGGSGFLWYGLPQPILDRAFDVWGRTNENYYWEISQALYSKNSDAFNKVLNKYQINWLIIDENVVPVESQKILFNSELKEIIENLPNIQKVRQLGKIEIYKVNLTDMAENFVFLSSQLPRVNGYKWGSDDIAYQNLGNYITEDKESDFDYFYPFRSLFSNKTAKDQEFEIRQNKDSLDFVAKLPLKKTAKLTLPSFNQVEKVIPVELIQNQNQDGSTLISARVKTPEIFIEQGNLTKVWEEKRQNPLFLIPSNVSYPLELNIGGTINLTINQSKKEKVLGSAFLVEGQNNIIILRNASGVIDSRLIQTKSADYGSGLIEVTLPPQESQTQIIVRVSKIDDSYLGFLKTPSDLLASELKNCDFFRNGNYYKELITFGNEKLLKLSSKHATACISYYSPNLIHDQGYAIFIKNQNIKGDPLQFWIHNEDGDYAPINTYLNKNKYLSDSTLILPPQERFGNSYSFHFENPSISDEAINYLGSIAHYPIPYRFLTSIKLSSLDNLIENYKTVDIETSHNNESLYSLSIKNVNDPSVLVLSQSYDKGWQAYSINHQSLIINHLSTVFPFVFGKPIGKHVIVNNWANGWILDSSIINHQSSIILVYLPQYLEYVGFILLTLSLLALLRKQ